MRLSRDIPIQVAEELSLDVIGLIQDGRLALMPDGDLILADPVTINQMFELAQNYRIVIGRGSEINGRRLAGW